MASRGRETVLHGKETLVMVRTHFWELRDALQLRAHGELTAAHDCGLKYRETDKRDERREKQVLWVGGEMGMGCGQTAIELLEVRYVCEIDVLAR